jgi:hypothetical protein
LEGADEGFQVNLRKRPDALTFLKFILDNVCKLVSKLNDGGVVGGGGGGGGLDWSEFDKETKIKVVWDVVVFGKKAGHSEKMFPSIWLVWGESLKFSELEGMFELCGWPDCIQRKCDICCAIC